MITVYHRSESNSHKSEYIKGDFGLALGSAAVVRNGKLVKASQNECPEYIVASCQCMNGTYASVRVNSDTVFAAPCIGGGDVLTGVKVMISEDDGGVTNTPGGAFLIDGVINHLEPSGTPIVKGRFVPESDERSMSSIKRELLTLDQLRKMDGKPAYWLEDESYGIISVDSNGKWAGIPFFRGRKNGVNFEYDIESRGMEIYAIEHTGIDRDKWEQCMWCETNKLIMGDKYCSECGRPLTEEAWTELERMIFGQ